MQLQNLAQLLRAAAKTYPEHGSHFYSSGQLDNNGEFFTYSELLLRAEHNAARLHRLRLRPGSIVLLHFNNQRDSLDWFWAVTLAGLTPAMSTPLSNNMDQRHKHLSYLHSLLEGPLCLTTRDLLAEFAGQTSLRIQLTEDLPASSNTVDGCLERDGLYCAVDQGRFKSATDLSVLMLTSGSTGNAKAVPLSHSNILHAVAGKAEMNQTNDSTPFFNWIGADHVACLTEIHLHALFVGATQVHAPAADLVAKPLLFIDLIQRHQIYYTFAPNFFLNSVLNVLEGPDGQNYLSGLSLSALSAVITGGEANGVDSCLRLSRILQQLGTASNVLKPAFGMTETCAGSIYNYDFPHHDVSRRHEFASLGYSINDMEIRIVDEHGEPVRQGCTGSLQVRGPVIFQRYYNNPQATEESFDGDWFITGDVGMIDDLGMLNLTGRAKETLIINGINYSPTEIESSLETLANIRPSYTAAFPQRPKGSPTEGLCIVYCPTYAPDDVAARVATNEAITKACMLHTGVRPVVLPLDERVLQKTTLGKLSRTKIRKSFEKGDYEAYRQFNEDETIRFRAAQFEKPANDEEQQIFDVLRELFDFPPLEMGVNSDLFALGVNSTDIIKIRMKLRERIGVEIPIVTIITNPTIRSLTNALEALRQPREYDPVVTLQREGSKPPLWLIHPGVGEVLVFVSLASQITDRPVYAMRARGFEAGEKYFNSIEEAVTIYHRRMKATQPEGPYAIAGYSFGSLIAFEIAKILEANGDEVRFLGVLNLPPHVKMRMRQLDWVNCLLHLSFFLGFFGEDEANDLHPHFQNLARAEALRRVLARAPAERVAELDVDHSKLSNWTDLAYAMQHSAVDYEPTGSVRSADVFAAIPVAAVSRCMDDWITNHLGKWNGFCREPPRFHRVDGAHYTMLNASHYHSFSKRLKAAMNDRGI